MYILHGYMQHLGFNSIRLKPSERTSLRQDLRVAALAEDKNLCRHFGCLGLKGSGFRGLVFRV